MFPATLKMFTPYKNNKAKSHIINTDTVTMCSYTFDILYFQTNLIVRLCYFGLK